VNFSWSLLSWASSAFLAVGVFLLVDGMLREVLGVAFQIWRRKQDVVMLRLRALRGEYEAAGDLRFQGFRINQNLVLIVLVVLSGVLARDAMMAILFVFIGIVAWFWSSRNRRQIRERKLMDDLEHTLQLLLSRFSVSKSMLIAIQDVARELDDNMMKAPLVHVADNMRTLAVPASAVQPLREMDTIHVNRLANLITVGESSSTAVQVDILRMLIAEVRKKRQIISEVMQHTGMVRGTMRFLQGAFLVGLLAIVNIPLWRTYFLDSGSHRMVLATLTSMALLGSLYFEYMLYSKVEGASQ